MGHAEPLPQTLVDGKVKDPGPARVGAFGHDGTYTVERSPKGPLPGRQGQSPFPGPGRQAFGHRRPQKIETFTAPGGNPHTLGETAGVAFHPWVFPEAVDLVHNVEAREIARPDLTED